MAALVPDESLTIDEGAVAPWNSLMWSLMTDVCRAMGVRTDVPFRDLTDREKDIVYHGPAEKKHIFYKPKNTNQGGELDFTYFNAVYTVENALSKVKDEKGMKRVEKFLKEDVCPSCHGTRLSEAARAPKLRGITLDEACAMTLSELVAWVRGVPESLPEEMRPMAVSICEAFESTAKRLMDLGLGYLTLDRSAATLSTGERQRMQLARAVRNRTTGVLYVLDEPSIGLHPSNIVGLTGVMHDLVADGNSVILVDHDTQILKEADWLIEMGPEAGAKGGHIIAQGPLNAVRENPASQIGPFLAGTAETQTRRRTPKERLFDAGTIHLATSRIHTVKPLEVDIPKGRLTVVTGVSGSGKTTMVLESLIPALNASISGETLPSIFAPWPPRAFSMSSSLTQRPLASTSDPPSPPTRGFTMSCGSCTPSRRTRKRGSTRPAIFPITPAPCAAPAATAQAWSALTCSSSRMWIFPARTAAAPATPEPPMT